MPAESFAVPGHISAVFSAIHGYWHSLKRGAATVPFTDDIRPGALGKLLESTALIDVFENPQRFRFNLVGTKVKQWRGLELEGRFADEIVAAPPFDLLLPQAGATIAREAPTFYRHSAERGAGYQRLMLPFWGDGHCNAILAAFEPQPPAGSP